MRVLYRLTVVGLCLLESLVTVLKGLLQLVGHRSGRSYADLR